jgi:hypothetical protein
MHLLLIALLFAGPATAGAQTGITGYVKEDSTGAPLAGAQVTIEALKKSTITDVNGKYSLGDISAGVRMVAIRHVGYEPTGYMVQVVDNKMTSKDFALQRIAPRLDTVRTRAAPTGLLGRALVAMEEHKAKGHGAFIDSTALQKRAGEDVSDFLRDIPGSRVVTPPLCQPLGDRLDNCVTSNRYHVATTGSTCAMQVRLDGSVVSRGGKIDDRFHPAAAAKRVGDKSIGGESSDPRHNWEATFDLTQVAASTLAAVEVFAHETDIPFELHGPEQECGLLLLWTRR